MATTTDAPLARRELESKASTSVDPVLSAQEVTDILATALVTDANAVEPNGTGYIPTYTTRSINAAASEAWRRKAGKAANQYTLSGGNGKKLERSDIHKHCLQMAAYYSVGTVSSIRSVRAVSSTVADSEVTL